MGSTDLMPPDLDLVEYSPEWGSAGFQCISVRNEKLWVAQRAGGRHDIC